MLRLSPSRPSQTTHVGCRSLDTRPGRAPRSLPPITSASSTIAGSTNGHATLLQGLGAVGDVAPSHVPWLLRLAHIQYASIRNDAQAVHLQHACTRSSPHRSLGSIADSEAAMHLNAIGLLTWKVAHQHQHCVHAHLHTNILVTHHTCTDGTGAWTAP